MENELEEDGSLGRLAIICIPIGVFIGLCIAMFLSSNKALDEIEISPAKLAGIEKGSCLSKRLIERKFASDGASGQLGPITFKEFEAAGNSCEAETKDEVARRQREALK